MSQVSSFLSIIGFVFTALAATLGLYISGLVLVSLGSAFVVTARSLATALVQPDQVGRLYSAAAVVQSIGTLIAEPWTAISAGWGLFGLATLAMSLVKAQGAGTVQLSGPESEPLLDDDLQWMLVLNKGSKPTGHPSRISISIPATWAVKRNVSPRCLFHHGYLHPTPTKCLPHGLVALENRIWYIGYRGGCLQS